MSRARPQLKASAGIALCCLMRKTRIAKLPAMAAVRCCIKVSDRNGLLSDLNSDNVCLEVELVRAPVTYQMRM